MRFRQIARKIRAVTEKKEACCCGQLPCLATLVTSSTTSSCGTVVRDPRDWSLPSPGEGKHGCKHVGRPPHETSSVGRAHHVRYTADRYSPSLTGGDERPADSWPTELFVDSAIPSLGWMTR